MINFSDIFTNNYILNLFPVNIQNYVEEYMLRNYYIVLIFVTRNFWNQKCRLIWIVRSYVAASKKRAAKSRVIVGEWPFRMVTIENTPPILSVGTGRAKGCVNNVRRSTFIREIWRENFVNETRTNKRLRSKKACDPVGVKVPFANSLMVCFHSYNNNINDFTFIDIFTKIPVTCCHERFVDSLLRHNIGWSTGNTF